MNGNAFLTHTSLQYIEFIGSEADDLGLETHASSQYQQLWLKNTWQTIGYVCLNIQSKGMINGW